MNVGETIWAFHVVTQPDEQMPAGWTRYRLPIEPGHDTTFANPARPPDPTKFENGRLAFGQQVSTRSAPPPRYRPYLPPSTDQRDLDVHWWVHVLLVIAIFALAFGLAVKP